MPIGLFNINVILISIKYLTINKLTYLILFYEFVLL